jgi:hypothetical protein
MKLLDFSTLAGWPVSSTVMKYMQEQMMQLQMMSLLGGNMYIVSGCEDDNAGGITDGVIVINGDVLPFVGSALVENAKVVITDTVGYKNFFGGNGYNPFYHNRIAQFGVTGNVQTEFAWANFKRNNPTNGLLARVDRLEKMVKPLVGYEVEDIDNPGNFITVYGSWLFWGRPANEIPDGFEAVPDAEWKGKMPVVLDGTGGETDFNVVGKVGGSRTHIVTKDNIQAFDVSKPGSSGTGGIGNPVAGSEANDGEVKYKIGVDNPTPISHLSPYKVVLFIRWVG